MNCLNLILISPKRKLINIYISCGIYDLAAFFILVCGVIQKYFISYLWDIVISPFFGKPDEKVLYLQMMNEKF